MGNERGEVSVLFPGDVSIGGRAGKGCRGSSDAMLRSVLILGAVWARAASGQWFRDIWKALLPIFLAAKMH